MLTRGGLSGPDRPAVASLMLAKQVGCRLSDSADWYQDCMAANGVRLERGRRLATARPGRRKATPAKAAQRWRRSRPVTMLPRGAGSCGHVLGICPHSADTAAISSSPKPCKLLILLDPASGLEPLTC